MVDPVTGERDPRVSQHGNAACILWDIAPREQWDSMVAYMTNPQRMKFTAAPPIAPTGDPYDAEHDVVRANTFYSHFVYRALCRAGRFDHALALMRAHYGRMLARGATTLWESFEPTASLCHGFSATPVYQLSTEVLGVFPLEPGFTRFRVSPQLADLAYARGVFPTVRGDVRVAWEHRGDGIELEIGVPDGTRAQLTPPDGYHIAAGTAELGPGTRVIQLQSVVT